MYEQIAANKRRTVVLIAAILFLAVGLGYAFDVLRHAGGSGVAFAGILASTMAIGSYYFGDRVALWSSGARPITKRDHPLLYRTVENLTIASGTPMPALYIIPDPALNAFATGRDPEHASIAVTTGALDTLANEELEGVLAHELSHIRNYDIRIMTVVVVLVGAIALLSDVLLRSGSLHRSREDREHTPPVLAIAGIVLALLAPFAAELIKLAISRRREYLADASGALLTRYPEGLARALEKIAQQQQPLQRATNATAHLFIANPFGAQRQRFMRLFSTHPPIADRIRILRGMTM
ncbi:M48 family metallopeptidase [Candidatus Uhrbacteria bacterium]|nr:M48 family metallopeptidase [Candidatus Uhrbacteria bacterium]